MPDANRSSAEKNTDYGMATYTDDWIEKSIVIFF